MSEARLRSFYDELKRRRVIRVATLYVVAIWPLIQLLDIISPTLELPDSVLRYLVIAFFSGLPFALILAWIFDLDRDGVRVDDGESHEPLFGSKADLTIVGVLCVLVVALFFVQVSLEDGPLMTQSPLPLVAPPTPVVADNSIAVKPFDSFSDNPRDEYFADGLSEELLNVLARVPELRVAARTSSFAYKGVNRNISEIGRELNVANILEGSVRANDIDNTIRVTAQLINVETGQHIWSETYTHQYADVFRIQDEISEAVAAKLKVTLFANDKSTPGSGSVRSSNPEALIAFGRGQQELAKRSKESLLAAAGYFQEAVTADPNFAVAYAGLSDAKTLLVSYKFADRSTLAEAEQAVTRALELDPELGIAWASKGLLQSQYKDKRDLARESLAKAMTLNPSYAMAVMWFASLAEDESEKIRLYEIAVKLDPRSPVASFNLAQMYAARGRDAEVMTLFSQMIEADPNYSRGYELVANISERNGQIGEAIRNYEQSFELGSNLSVALTISKLYAEIGEFEQADSWYEKVKAEVPDAYKTRVLWFRLGRFIAAREPAEATKLLRTISMDPATDLEGALHRLAAQYELGNRESLVRDYQMLLSQNLEAVNDDDFLADLRADLQINIADQMIAEGDAAGAEQLLTLAEQKVNADIENVSMYWPEDWYKLARIAAVRGQSQQALILLQRAIDEGFRERWLPIHDPVMRNLQDSRMFTTMMDGLENRLAIVRDQFQMEAEFAMGF
jgi:TolB-like protein/Tfp pilus assembly protein PilF